MLIQNPLQQNMALPTDRNHIYIETSMPQTTKSLSGSSARKDDAYYSDSKLASNFDGNSRPNKRRGKK